MVLTSKVSGSQTAPLYLFASFRVTLHIFRPLNTSNIHSPFPFTPHGFPCLPPTVPAFCSLSTGYPAFDSSHSVLTALGPGLCVRHSAKGAWPQGSAVSIRPLPHQGSAVSTPPRAAPSPPAPPQGSASTSPQGSAVSAAASPPSPSVARGRLVPPVTALGVASFLV